MAVLLEPGVSRGPSKDKDVAVTIVDAKFVADYLRGKSNPSVAGIVTFRGEDGEEFTQSMKAGSPEYFAVTPDGTQLISANPSERPDEKLRLSPKAELSHFFNSLLKNGVSASKLGSSIKNIVGIKGTARAFVVETYTKSDGTTGENLVVMFTKIDPASIGAAVSPSPATTAAASQSGPAGTAGTNGSSAAASEHAIAVLKLIVAEGSKFKVGDGLKDLRTAAFRTFVKAKIPATARMDTMKLITSADFVNTVDGFMFDGTEIERV
jgi:hypothetical protein